jgi:Ca2+-binding RTX toxin-like protein
MVGAILGAATDGFGQTGNVVRGLSGNDTLSGTVLNDVIFGFSGQDSLSGLDGNDTLNGGPGNDNINGGAGDDTAVFSGNLAAYALQDLGNRVLVSGPDGNDTVSSTEHLQFGDGTINYNDGDPLIDAIFYDRNNLDVFHAGVDAKAHYNTNGFHEGRDPNGFFLDQWLSGFQSGR